MRIDRWAPGPEVEEQWRDGRSATIHSGIMGIYSDLGRKPSGWGLWVQVKSGCPHDTVKPRLPNKPKRTGGCRFRAKT
jgi:hypothetical protein